MSKSISTLLKIKVIPNSSREQIVGWLGDTLKIKLQAPPEDGKANKALKRLLAETLELNQKNIIIEQGETSSEKCIRILDRNLEDIKIKLSSEIKKIKDIR